MPPDLPPDIRHAIAELAGLRTLGSESTGPDAIIVARVLGRAGSHGCYPPVATTARWRCEPDLSRLGPRAFTVPGNVGFSTRPEPTTGTSLVGARIAGCGLQRADACVTYRRIPQPGDPSSIATFLPVRAFSSSEAVCLAGNIPASTLALHPAAPCDGEAVLEIAPQCLGEFPPGSYDVVVWVCVLQAALSYLGGAECHPYIVDGFQTLDYPRSLEYHCQSIWLDLPSFPDVRGRVCLPQENPPLGRWITPKAMFLFTHGERGGLPLDPPQYERYDYLLEHLAQQGFAAVSVASRDDVDVRRDILVETVARVPQLLRDTWNYHFHYQIMVGGHSRGGHAAALAGRLLGDDVKAVVALGPVNRFPTDPDFTPVLGPRTAYLGIYGTYDGDATQFQALSQYDRIVGGGDRGYLMLRRGTHAGFVNVDLPSPDTDPNLGNEMSPWFARALDTDVQREVVKYSVSSFLEWQTGNTAAADMFYGGDEPFAIILAAIKDPDRRLEIYPRFSHRGATVLFDENHDFATLETEGVAPPAPKGLLNELINPGAMGEQPGVKITPHHSTWGMRVTWDRAVLGSHLIRVGIDLPATLSTLVGMQPNNWLVTVDLGLVADSPLNELGPDVSYEDSEPLLGFGTSAGLKDPHAWLAPRSGVTLEAAAPFVEQVGDDPELQVTRLRTVVYRLRDFAWKLAPDEEPDYFDDVTRLFLDLSEVGTRRSIDIVMGNAYLVERPM